VAVSSPATVSLDRVPRRDRPQRIPRALADRGLYVVDGSWGTLQPIQLAKGVQTVAELEVIERMRAGGPLIDTRPAAVYAATTIPTATNIPHTDAIAHLDELDPSVPAVFFCNGPACSATPAEIATLLAAGHPPEAMLYYRGGLHDWITLGLPVAPPGD
jgi:rhodanese-related sulfurtransferase